jgi:putative restriction endonuclease
MYIRKQPSGNTRTNIASARRGRGEYEVSEPFAREDGTIVAARELRGHRLIVAFGRYGFRETGNVPKEESGKTRVRLLKVTPRNVHLARQVQAALLFPKSRRDESGFTGGEPVIWEERYIVRKMNFASLSLPDDHSAHIGLGDLDLDNGSGNILAVDFKRRMKLVERLHNNATRFPVGIGSLLDQHRAMLESAEPIKENGEAIVGNLMDLVAEIAPDFNVAYVAGGDVLPSLLEMIDIEPIDEPVDVDRIEQEDIKIRLREAALWRRWAAGRTSAHKFRRAVRDAYNSTCVVCGIRLPLSDLCRVPGVDAAHILPWAKYELELVSNGLCLCKLHHWAFDQQLISIQHDGDTYSVVVTDRAAKALDVSALGLLKQHEGPVPNDRLPALQDDRPRPQFLAKLYELLGD